MRSGSRPRWRRLLCLTWGARRCALTVSDAVLSVSGCDYGWAKGSYVCGACVRICDPPHRAHPLPRHSCGSDDVVSHPSRPSLFLSFSSFSSSLLHPRSHRVNRSSCFCDDDACVKTNPRPYDADCYDGVRTNACYCRGDERTCASSSFLCGVSHPRLLIDKESGAREARWRGWSVCAPRCVRS